MKTKLLVLISVLTMSAPAWAAKFANQFTEFELPPKWQCNLEGAEWVCQSTDELRKKDAIIVLAAKIKGDQDSLDQYLSYLKAVKSYTSIQGKPVKSEPKYAKNINLNGHPWIDSLHLESEIPGFFTRYLATVKDDIGVLVTYSINKAKYQDYLTDFENMVRTLKVFRKSGSINVAPQNTNLFQNAQVPQTLSESSVFPGAGPEGGAGEKAPAKQGGNSLLIIALAAAGAIGFLIWKKKKQG